jgi:hypothetical protein
MQPLGLSDSHLAMFSHGKSLLFLHLGKAKDLKLSKTPLQTSQQWLYYFWLDIFVNIPCFVSMLYQFLFCAECFTIWTFEVFFVKYIVWEVHKSIPLSKKNIQCKSPITEYHNVFMTGISNHILLTFGVVWTMLLKLFFIKVSWILLLVFKNTSLENCGDFTCKCFYEDKYHFHHISCYENFTFH